VSERKLIDPSKQRVVFTYTLVAEDPALVGGQVSFQGYLMPNWVHPLEMQAVGEILMQLGRNIMENGQKAMMAAVQLPPGS
jgi:hypothetical protein